MNSPIIFHLTTLLRGLHKSKHLFGIESREKQEAKSLTSNFVKLLTYYNSLDTADFFLTFRIHEHSQN